MVEDPDGYPGAPRWVKIAGIAFGAVLLLLIVVLVLGGGEHGPGRHAPQERGDVDGADILDGRSDTPTQGTVDGHMSHGARDAPAGPPVCAEASICEAVMARVGAGAESRR